jgi:hypothetical protein
MTTAMPEQHFTDPETGHLVAEARWDFALSGIEIYYLGQPLTRLADVVQLRTFDGITGPLPDGGTITVRLTRTTGAESVALERNGHPLQAGIVKWAATVEPGDIAPRMRDMGKKTGWGRKLFRFGLGIVVVAVAGSGGYALYMANQEKSKPDVPPVQAVAQADRAAAEHLNNFDLPTANGAEHGIS